MFGDQEFMTRTVLLQTTKRIMGTHKYRVEVAASRTKCYITCMKGTRICQVIWLWSRQAIKMIAQVSNLRLDDFS